MNRLENGPAYGMRSRAGVGIPKEIPLPDGTESQRIDAGTYARYSHIGPFNVLGDVGSRSWGEALPASGQVVADGPAIELYRSDMRTTPLERFRTDLRVRIR